MGKRLGQQARGRGTPRYLSPGHRFVGVDRYNFKEGEFGNVIDIVHDPGRSVPVAIVEMNDGRKKKFLAGKGMYVGQKIEFGKDIMKLSDMVEGAHIYNIENIPGDGGQLCRSSGALALLLTKGKKECVIQLPSKKKKTVSSKCLATIGRISGTGRIEKPFRKAGRMYHAKKARNKIYPKVSGVSQNAVDHPFGGCASPGIHKTVSRHAPPGKKVGNIAAKRMGRKKR